MPELPEVENLRRSLAAAVKGQRVKKVLVYWPKIVSGRGNARRASRAAARKFARGVSGRKICGIERRGKNLIFLFSGGRRVIVHLKMSGGFRYYPAGKYGKPGNETPAGRRRRQNKIAKVILPGKHDHVVFQLSKGTLVYNDARKFGYLIYYPAAKEAEKHFAKIGVEPLSREFTPQYFEEALARKNARIKTVLMSQAMAAGLGNIYCDEALFLAGIHPTRRASSLKPAEIEKLHGAIRQVLSRAIKLGGSTVFTYRTMEGKRGRYVDEHKVYGRAGEKCKKCGARLKGIRINSRTTVYCPRCQK